MQPADLEQLTGSQRHDLAGRHCGTVDSDVGRATDDGDMACGDGSGTRVPPPVISNDAAPSRLPTRRLANKKESGSAGPALGTPKAATP